MYAMQHNLTQHIYFLYSNTCRLFSNHGQFSFGNWQQFCLDYSPEYITCSVALPPDEMAEEVECQYPHLIAFLQKTLNEICALSLPSARKPVACLNCPLDHPEDYLHILPLNKITEEGDLICSITKKTVPKKHYALLVKLNSELCYLHSMIQMHMLTTHVD